jgi:acylphosphatase
VWHRWQWFGGWSGWSRLGGDARQIVVGQNGDGRLEVFAIGREDYALHHIWQQPEGGWSQWRSLGGGVVQIVVGRNRDGRLEVFGIGAGWQVYHIWQQRTGGWSAWTPMGGGALQLAIAQNTDGRMELFAVGGDQAVHHIWQVTPNGTWGDWSSLGGGAARIAVGRNRDGRLEVFVVGTDAAVHHTFQWFTPTGWSNWESMGGGFISTIAAGQNADGRLNVFVITWANTVFHKMQYQPPVDTRQWPLRDPFKVSRGSAGHGYPAIDLAPIPAGRSYPVYPMESGRVIAIIPDSGTRCNPPTYGNYVIVDHGNGLTTLYAHFSRFRPGLRVGDQVTVDTALGDMGTTGCSTGVHLHFEVRFNNVRREPLLYLPPR